MSMRNEWIAKVERLRLSPAFQNYLHVRERVWDLLERTPGSHEASAYWREEFEGFEYMLDASPLVIEKLREHCFHLTGIRSYDYRAHHRNTRPAFEKKLEMLQAAGNPQLFVEEAEALGGFGFQIGGKRVNLDTLKFYECLIALDRADILPGLRDSSADRKIVVEIGAGWGGFAYQVKKLAPNVTYCIVDLPGTLLFSATYLKTVYPEAKVAIYGEPGTDRLLSDPTACDFLFLPHYAWTSFRPKRLDLVVNMVSFQEMTTAQVEGYLSHARELNCGALYSMNRDRSPCNDEIDSVSRLMAKYFDTRESPVLEQTYVDLPVSSAKGATAMAIEAAKRVARSLLAAPHLRYRHLIGRPKPSV